MLFFQHSHHHAICTFTSDERELHSDSLHQWRWPLPLSPHLCSPSHTSQGVWFVWRSKETSGRMRRISSGAHLCASLWVLIVFLWRQSYLKAFLIYISAQLWDTRVYLYIWYMEAFMGCRLLAASERRTLGSNYLCGYACSLEVEGLELGLGLHQHRGSFIGMHAMFSPLW